MALFFVSFLLVAPPSSALVFSTMSEICRLSLRLCVFVSLLGRKVMLLTFLYYVYLVFTNPSRINNDKALPYKSLSTNQLLKFAV
ncbi:hypothetical protein BJ878DRAFT_524271 [Calycina marina]|uniref:Secreted protein n=1 Tax=Calycina marina TaxID=1763456 RepID=A0A9P7YVW3_9HELO|nr:hypothetical protein BJ878DRAFT_524271 [Calycina marina]